jgi:hypothetical protein
MPWGEQYEDALPETSHSEILSFMMLNFASNSARISTVSRRGEETPFLRNFPSNKDSNAFFTGKTLELNGVQDRVKPQCLASMSIKKAEVAPAKQHLQPLPGVMIILCPRMPSPPRTHNRIPLDGIG